MSEESNLHEVDIANELAIERLRRERINTTQSKLIESAQRENLDIKGRKVIVVSGKIELPDQEPLNMTVLGFEELDDDNKPTGMIETNYHQWFFYPDKEKS